MLRQLRPFLSRGGKRRVSEAIARAEKGTTGEIHVHIMSLAPPRDILAVAERVFHELGLQKTRRRNGVLILISTGDRRFAIWGDRGIHAAAGQLLWEKAKEALAGRLREGRHAEALEDCVREVGRALTAHFPKEAKADDNELPDEVTES